MTDVFDLLQPWREAGVLDPSDVHVADVLARLGAVDLSTEDGRLVVLGAALAARGPRHGHVCVDLRTIERNCRVETEPDVDDSDTSALDRLVWPSDDAWVAALRGSVIVRVAGDAVPDGPERPLVLDGSLLYLSRYENYEARVASELLARAAVRPGAMPIDAARVDEILGALQPRPAQRRAIETGVTRPFAVVLGGPGTGKTHTVATMLAILLDDAPERFRVALAAPTGKAAARMGASIIGAAARLRASGIARADRLADRLVDAASAPVTLHKLLGANPVRASWRHDSSNPLVHDIVIVDETSMVSLPLMARLLDAVRPDASLVLVGDPGQLASVEAGSVLSDIAAGAASPTSPLVDCVTVLDESMRFPADSAIGRFADAVRRGDVDAALQVLVDAHADPAQSAESAVERDGAVRLRWFDDDAASRTAPPIVHSLAAPSVFRLHDVAAQGDAQRALEVLEELRMLCAHRHGPYGVSRWNRQVEEWLAARGVHARDAYPGRPVLVTANDPTRRLFNGDLGVVVRHEGASKVAFPDADGPRLLPPSQLEDIETVHAMTIHKSQGSEFGHVIVILPPASSRLATRELLYTAVTRAEREVGIIGTRDAVAAAIARRVERASGLAGRLVTAEVAK